MTLKLQNTLTKQKEEFNPINKNWVGLYHCGPTVYNYAHIGNLRAYVFADILRRTLEFNNFKVKQVINITDVGHLTSDEDEGADKVEEAVKKEKKTAKEITKFYTEAFLEDLKKLNIKTTDTQFPKATDYINEQIDLIKKLEEKGFTYNISDGIYFDTSKLKNYGELGGLDIEGLKEGARIEKNKEKKNITDFALWKFSTSSEKREQEWESPWGVGFPGWHLECSAMSMKILGSHFDIHTGGIDHIPVHHTNEIAQSESATGEKFVNYWLHSGFVNFKDIKMAKSEGNFVTLEALTKEGFNPIAYRYWLLTAHYDKTINFNEEASEGAEKALTKLLHAFLNLGEKVGKIDLAYKAKFESFINDDLDTPQSLALVWELIKDLEIKDADKKATLLKFDKVLGLGLDKVKAEIISDEILGLSKEREKAREEKDWAESDRLRDDIEKLGYEVKDTDSGSQINKI